MSSPFLFALVLTLLAGLSTGIGSAIAFFARQFLMCKSENISRMRRITGYLTGSLESWNSAKQAEERDRVKHK